MAGNGWGKPKMRANQGFGFACGFEQGGCVGTCAEVLVEPSTRGVKIARVVTAFECGAVVNPEHLKNPDRGLEQHGISGALFEAIEGGNSRFMVIMKRKARILHTLT